MNKNYFLHFLLVLNVYKLLLSGYCKTLFVILYRGGGWWPRNLAMNGDCFSSQSFDIINNCFGEQIHKLSGSVNFH
jgi:hypothetical protein